MGKIINYLLFVAKNIENNYTLETNKELLIKVFDYLKDYKLINPIDYLKVFKFLKVYVVENKPWNYDKIHK